MRGWPRLGALGWRPTSAAVRSRLTLLAAAAFALALWHPKVPWPVRTGAVLMVVDITQSMNVADMGGADAPLTRLAHTQALLRRVLRELPCGQRLGIGAFTERKTMVLLAPLEVCAHYAALDDVLGGLDWRMAWAADSHLYYGVHSALGELRSRWPGTALAFFTDGHQAPALFRGREPRYQPDADSPGGLLFGVGGELPQPVPRLDGDNRITGYWTADEAAAFASTGAATLSVQDMERMAAGDDVRNAAQRPAGAGVDHLSARRDDVLKALAEQTGLSVARASSARDVVAALRDLPGGERQVRHVDLHDPLVALAALALLASLWPAGARLPWPRLQRRRPVDNQAHRAASLSPEHPT